MKNKDKPKDIQPGFDHGVPVDHSAASLVEAEGIFQKINNSGFAKNLQMDARIKKAMDDIVSASAPPAAPRQMVIGVTGLWKMHRYLGDDAFERFLDTVEVATTEQGIDYVNKFRESRNEG